jgi:predicted regulator of Ras-like GTPase activity (Roadblock/LC7/MglB family)
MQSQLLGGILKNISEECDADAVAVCDVGGNVIAQDVRVPNKSFTNAAALAAGSFAATRELAGIIGEPGFRSIFHKGRKSGVLIQSLGGDFLILVVLGEKSVEGMVRLFLRKVSRQIGSILATADGQSLEDAGVTEQFEIEEAADVTEKD